MMTRPSQLFRGVIMCYKMAISAYILKIVEMDSFLRLQIRAKEEFNHKRYLLLLLVTQCSCCTHV